MKAHGPYLFDEFFASGLQESISPFLTPSSRPWGHQLALRSSLLSLGLLTLAFAFSFFTPPFSLVCLSLVYFLAGVPALIASFNDLKNLEINIDVLMTLAAFLALGVDSALEGGLLLVLFSLSHEMEHSVSGKARSALLDLNRLAPKFACVVGENGTFFEKSVREVTLGTHLLVKNGEVVPLDGQVIEGQSSVNLVHLTGESVPVVKKEGDLVPAGARNLEAALIIKVQRISADSTLARIQQLILQAQEAKPKLQQWLDRFSKRYATGIILLTCLFALLPPLFLSLPYLGPEGSIYRALAFLIAASPCALIIATPTAYLSAISACARKGVLLKGGITLDALTQCRLVAFDKTGTLTTGELECLSITPQQTDTLSEETLLSVAFGLEKHVVHPIANAICKLAQKRALSPAPVTQIKPIAGWGLEGVWKGLPVRIGLPPPEQKKRGAQVLAALFIGEEMFLFQFQDQIRPQSKQVIASLHETGKLSTVMLTGDHIENASHVAETLGIASFFSDLRPEDKLQKIVALSERQDLAMVGDGINDAPALARATVGISMGRMGSATTVDISDVVLLNDELSLLPWVFEKAHSTLRIVKQNLSLALSVICLATLPALLGWIPLWLAVILHEGGTVLVGVNSLRLLRS